MRLRFFAAAGTTPATIYDFDTRRTVATLPDPVFEKELGVLFEAAPNLLSDLEDAIELLDSAGYNVSMFRTTIAKANGLKVVGA